MHGSKFDTISKALARALMLGADQGK